MSSLEWMQLQHYKQWRKRLIEDPYNTMFGASNDMLNGKGLKDWEWISKTFPRWMLREMDEPVENDKDKNKDSYASEFGKKASKDESSAAQTRDNSTCAKSSYSNVANSRHEWDAGSKRRESYFPQPSFRATRLDRDDFTGIISPSDLRRPREQPHVKVVGKAAEVRSESTSDMHHTNSFQNTPVSSASHTPGPAKKIEPVGGQLSELSTSKETSSKEAIARETSFIEQFLADTPPNQSYNANNQIVDDKTWRQTALQRRSSRELISKSAMKPSPIADLSDATTKTTTSREPEAIELPPPQATEHTPEVTTQYKDWLVEQEPPASVTANRTEESTGTGTSRSPLNILDQIPKDDIDFLTAADIRASMGVRRSKIPSDEERRAKRQKLEETFKKTHETSEDINPMIESKIINDQLIRRLERELQQAPDSQGFIKAQTEQHYTEPATVQENVIESSIERMKRWLEQGGAMFSSHFWQDPTEEADATKTKLFFDKIVGRIRKGRIAMRQVVEDLEMEIPATKPLLKRLKDDEEMLDMAIRALRLRVGTGKPHSLTPRKAKAIQALRSKFMDTDRELDAAFTTLNARGKTDAAKSVSLVTRRRISVASKICHKNAHLTRHLIWSLQARLEDPEIDQSILMQYQAVANSLLTLRDTQMALARLVDHAMQIYRVGPTVLENTEFSGQKPSVVDQSPVLENGELERSSSISEAEKANIRAHVAAEERLANEVEAQKSAMRGLSDDGYARTLKLTPKKTFDERSPLAHSLFRPFGPVLESLGKETAENAEAAKANEDAKKKLDDAKLVAQVRKAYEDTYGPITVGHRQVTSSVEEATEGHERDVKTFEMLKDDPTSSAPTVDHASSEQGIDFPALSTEPPLELTKERSTVAPVAHEEVRPHTSDAVAVAENLNEAEPHLDTALGSAKAAAAVATAAEPHNVAPQQHSEISSDSKHSFSSTADLPTHYTILIHDAQTDDLSITTSTTGPPRDISPALALHEALSTLDTPAKFIPYISEGLEIVTAKKDMLVLRDSLDNASSTRSFETIRAPPSTTSTEELETERRTVNPIDGTARLSPTGYVGPEESQEQLEKEFEERREAADRFSRKGGKQQDYSQDQKETKGRRKGGAGSVAKTAIWAAAVCYVVGVFGEIATTSPFQA
ncbi:hypothetical protein N0V83_010236 [Neocucurbitaria cava]|uniref:Uncharacterized protein n=1 Tax=Neocucurbitaria cava TaxID=798079 RepID=A0A9W9CHU5_9PLEO|nr:hypothetical protein N0V83_010236 [Neocucurbitaria cava]